MTRPIDQNETAAAMQRAASADPNSGLFEWRLNEDSFWASDRVWSLLAPADDSTCEQSVRSGADFFAGFEAEDVEAIVAAFDGATHGKGPQTTVGRTCFGDRRRVKVNAIASRDAAGESCVSGVVRDVEADVAEREQMQARQRRLQAQSSQAAVDGLAAGVAHEFNNVLQVIRGYITFAWQSVDEDSPLGEDLQHAMVATDRAADIATRLLRFARAQDEVDAESSINDVISDLALLLRPVMGPEVELRFACATEPMSVRGADASLRHAILNLCVNARDAMSDGGYLLVRAERFDTPVSRPDIGGGLPPGRYCRISVADTGGGISDEVRTALFEPFFSTKSDKGGTGLGLAIVLESVERMGGAVHLESVQSVGSTFTLFVPISDTNERVARVGRDETIVVATGRAEESRAVCAALGKAGFRAHAVANVDQANRLVRNRKVDLTIVDQHDVSSVAGSPTIGVTSGSDLDAGVSIGNVTGEVLIRPLDTVRLARLIRDKVSRSLAAKDVGCAQADAVPQVCLEESPPETGAAHSATG